MDCGTQLPCLHKGNIWILQVFLNASSVVSRLVQCTLETISACLIIGAILQGLPTSHGQFQTGLSTTSMVFTVEKTSLSATMVSQPFSLEILREIQNTMPMSHIKGVLKSRLDILCGSKRFRFSLLFLPCYLLTVLIYRFMKD